MRLISAIFVLGMSLSLSQSSFGAEFKTAKCGGISQIAPGEWNQVNVNFEFTPRLNSSRNLHVSIVNSDFSLSTQDYSAEMRRSNILFLAGDDASSLSSQPVLSFESVGGGDANGFYTAEQKENFLIGHLKNLPFGISKKRLSISSELACVIE